MKITSNSFTRTVRKDAGCQYLLYVPQGYCENSRERWPVILFLHSAGERGSSLDLVKTHGPPRLVEEGAEFPFIIVGPHCPEGEWWSPDMLVALLDLTSENHHVDEDRVYVTGLSMGGLGTWHVALRTRSVSRRLRPSAGHPLGSGLGPWMSFRFGVSMALWVVLSPSRSP